jgi:hypothetical protein
VKTSEQLFQFSADTPVAVHIAVKGGTLVNLVYLLNYYALPDIKCPDGTSNGAKKLLLVADSPKAMELTP